MPWPPINLREAERGAPSRVLACEVVPRPRCMYQQKQDSDVNTIFLFQKTGSPRKRNVSWAVLGARPLHYRFEPRVTSRHPPSPPSPAQTHGAEHTRSLDLQNELAGSIFRPRSPGRRLVRSSCRQHVAGSAR